MQLRAQAAGSESAESGQLMITEAQSEPAMAPAAAKPRGDKEKAAQRAKASRAKRKSKKNVQSGSSARQAAPAAIGEEEKQLAHGQPPSRKRMRLTSRQQKREKLQAALDALDTGDEQSGQPDRYRDRQPSRRSSEDEQDWRYGHYHERAPIHRRGPEIGYEGYGPAPGALGYPHYGPWSGMAGHHAPRRQSEGHQASHRYPKPGGMDPYQQPRLRHDPYGQAHMDTRPRLQVKKRPVDRQSQDTMDDRSDTQ